MVSQRSQLHSRTPDTTLAPTLAEEPSAQESNSDRAEALRAAPPPTDEGPSLLGGAAQDPVGAPTWAEAPSHDDPYGLGQSSETGVTECGVALKAKLPPIGPLGIDYAVESKPAGPSGKLSISLQKKLPEAKAEIVPGMFMAFSPGVKGVASGELAASGDFKGTAAIELTGYLSVRGGAMDGASAGVGAELKAKNTFATVTYTPGVGWSPIDAGLTGDLLGSLKGDVKFTEKDAYELRLTSEAKLAKYGYDKGGGGWYFGPGDDLVAFAKWISDETIANPALSNVHGAALDTTSVILEDKTEAELRRAEELRQELASTRAQFLSDMEQLVEGSHESRRLFERVRDVHEIAAAALGRCNVHVKKVGAASLSVAAQREVTAAYAAYEAAAKAYRAAMELKKNPVVADEDVQRVLRDCANHYLAAADHFDKAVAA